MTVLIDTSFMLAVADVTDPNHVRAMVLSRALTDVRIVVQPVLPELFYMVSQRVNYASAVRLFTTIQTRNFQIEALLPSDMARMRQIMEQYSDSRLDFVDIAIMAVAERLNITEVCTLDRRDFAIFRPSHCDYLQLLP